MSSRAKRIAVWIIVGAILLAFVGADLAYVLWY
jgi:hypothetical protein